MPIPVKVENICEKASVSVVLNINHRKFISATSGSERQTVRRNLGAEQKMEVLIEQITLANKNRFGKSSEKMTDMLKSVLWKLMEPLFSLIEYAG